MNRPLYFEYPVQIGDTLPALIQSVYGSSPSSCHHEDVLQTLQALNPHLRTNPPWHPGMILRLSDCVPAHVPGGGPCGLNRCKTHRSRGLFGSWPGPSTATCCWLQGLWPWGASTLMSPGNLDLLRRIGDDYALYKLFVETVASTVVGAGFGLVVGLDWGASWV
ncbi:hypothetical protein [Caldimonas sp.]|uniref:hypothetical protein n=1 Tax=Caldimonas sp. TaxID=2838790 RepID=UPI00307DDB2C